MAVFPYYYQVERGVYGLINALKSDTVATAETNFRAAVMTPDTIVKNPMFPPTFARVEIVNMERVIADMICSTDGHPRRVDFLKNVTKTHGSPLPSSVGGIGAVYQDTGPERLYYTNRPVDVVEAVRASEQISVGAASPRAERLWAWDGSMMWISTGETVTVETYEYEAAITAYATLDSLFTLAPPSYAKLPIEFQAAWECGAAAVLAAKVGTFPREASDYWQKFTSLMQMQGVSVSLDLDYAAKESN